MARRRSAAPNKIFILVFSIAFGLLALALGYQAVMNSTDIRSRAAQAEKIYKQWEFNGSSAEGWITKGSVNSEVKNGRFVLTQKKAKTPTSFFHNKVNTSVPQGLKTVSISMAVGPVMLPTTSPGLGTIKTNVQGVSDTSQDVLFQEAITQKIACVQDIRTCSDGSYVARAGALCNFLPCPMPPVRRFTGQLYLRLTNKMVFEKPLEFAGIADGKFQELKLTLPSIAALGIEQMRFVITSGVEPGEIIAIDWIRISSTIFGETPLPTTRTTGILTPTPSKVCKTGVNSFAVDTACTGGYRYMTFRCYDGFGRREGGTTSCKSSEVWSSYAQQYCQGHSSCPTVTSTPPPPGCYLQKVVCVTEPCDPILVCPSPNPTLNATTTIKPPVTGTGCIRSGCNNELCVDSANGGMESPCVYKESYACYANARCEKQANGLCGWTQTTELSACLSGSAGSYYQ